MSWKDRTRAEIRAAQAHFAASLMSLPGVVGLGIGRKITGGQPMNDLVLRIYVEQKKELRYLRKCFRLPPVLPHFTRSRRTRAPKEIGIDLIEVGSGFVPCQTPLLMGESVSLANPRYYSDGTMGAILKDQNNKYYLLSNNHVLADVNAAAVNSKVIHPSKLEGGSLAAKSLAGTLERFVEIQRFGGNEVDAALASIPSGTTTVKGIGRVSVLGPTPGEGKPCKLFRKTIGQVVKGSVFDKDLYSIRIPFPNPIVGSATFRKLIVVKIAVARGDSGSLVLDDKNRAFGLVMGMGYHDFALVCPLNRVLELLGSKDTSTGKSDLVLELA